MGADEGAGTRIMRLREGPPSVTARGGYGGGGMTPSSVSIASDNQSIASHNDSHMNDSRLHVGKRPVPSYENISARGDAQMLRQGKKIISEDSRAGLRTAVEDRPKGRRVHSEAYQSSFSLFTPPPTTQPAKQSPKEPFFQGGESVARPRPASSRRHIDGKGRLTLTPDHVACIATRPPTFTDPILQRGEGEGAGRRHTGKCMVPPPQPPQITREPSPMRKRQSSRWAHAESNVYMLVETNTEEAKRDAHQKHEKLKTLQRHAGAAEYNYGVAMQEQAHKQSSKKLNAGKNDSHTDVIHSYYAPRPTHEDRTPRQSALQPTGLGSSTHQAKMYKARSHASALALVDHLYDARNTPSDVAYGKPDER